MSAAVRQLAAQPRNFLLAVALVLPALLLAALLQGGPFAAERSLPAPPAVAAPSPVAAAQAAPAVVVAVEEDGFQWSAATAEDYAWSGAIRWEDR